MLTEERERKERKRGRNKETEEEKNSLEKENKTLSSLTLETWTLMSIHELCSLGSQGVMVEVQGAQERCPCDPKSLRNTFWIKSVDFFVAGLFFFFFNFLSKSVYWKDLKIVIRFSTFNKFSRC